MAPRRTSLALAATCVVALGGWIVAQGAAGSAPRPLTGPFSEVYSAHAAAVLSTPHFKARLVRVGPRFHFPTYVAGTPADPNAFYVVERTGRIWIVRNGKRISRPFLDLHRDITIGPTSEQGLLSMAFDPNYAKNRAFYVFYTNPQGNIRVEQFHRSKRDPNRTNFSSGRFILAITHNLTDKHYAGQLQFGPRDHDLYISVGDGGVMADANDTAQHLDTLLGKILRIDVHHRGRHHPYKIPRGNPFANHAGALPEIYAYGLRNPFRFSFDPKTGGVWIGDVGENTWDEVDYRNPRNFPGTNFGWPRYEGPAFFSNVPAPGAVFPVISKRHYGAGPHEHWCAVIGGFVDRDPKLRALHGRYFFADHCSGEIDVARISKRGRAYGVVPTGLFVPGLVTSLGVDGQQRIYIMAEDGSIYRFVAR